MKLEILLFAFIGFSFICKGQTNTGDSISNSIKIFDTYSADSIFINPVYIYEDAVSKEKKYFEILETSVCSDTLCRIANLKIYWDLAGNYLKFDTISGNPLTKNDHLEFDAFDYQKLHQTLSDDNSILGDKTKEELIDNTKVRVSETIDAVSGATAQEIKSVVVDGALYTTYSLWQLTHGTIKQQLRNYTEANYNPIIENQLLKSKNPKSLIFGLRNMKEDIYSSCFNQIIDIMKQGTPLVNFYIAKNIPKSVLSIKKNKESILMIWESLDRNTTSILSEKLKINDYVHHEK